VQRILKRILQEMTMNSETIVLGGGCFWCLEAVYKEVRGVLDVQSGYCNGHALQPHYELVCSGNSGHVEVVRLVFDPQQIPLGDILGIFFAIHDPTTLNRQGNDVGTQYRSGIYHLNDAQKAVATELMRGIVQTGIWERPLVTELLPLDNYHPAEGYHQDYYERNPDQGYCAFVVGPKVAKFRQKFSQYLRTA
jgi:peptide-methionine (S)-S-oxide reductase